MSIIALKIALFARYTRTLSDFALIYTGNDGMRPTVNVLVVGIVEDFIRMIPMATAGAILAGLPLHALFQHLKIHDLKLYLATSASLGAVASVVTFADLSGVAIFAFPPAFGSFVFWLIRRPDRDQLSPT